MKAFYQKYSLHFKHPAKTSRGTLEKRNVWYLFLNKNGITGVGECAPLPGLSSETEEQAEQALIEVCKNPELFINRQELTNGVSSVRFALETALLDLQNGGRRLLFPSPLPKAKPAFP